MGMSQLTKDRFDVGSKSIAILGGIISAIVLIITLQANTRQRARELRWSQTKTGQELVDKMLDDKKAFDALRMVDWESPTFSIKGQPETVINLEEVRIALNTENADLDDKRVYIRECFDRLFYHMGKIERALNNELVRFQDISYPLDFYVGIFRNEKETFDVIEKYMTALRHREAMSLFRKFPAAESMTAPRRETPASTPPSNSVSPRVEVTRERRGKRRGRRNPTPDPSPTPPRGRRRSSN